MNKILSLICFGLFLLTSTAFSQPLVTLTVENRHAVNGVYYADVMATVNGSWNVGNGNIRVITNSPTALNSLAPTNFILQGLINVDADLVAAGYNLTLTGTLVPSININIPIGNPQINKTGKFRIATLRWNVVNATLTDNAVFGTANPNATLLNNVVSPLTLDCSGGATAYCLVNPTSQVIGTAFPAPVLVTPANAAINVPFASGVSLAWNQVNTPGTAEATAYEYQLSSNVGFTSVITSATLNGVANTSATITGLSPNTQYFWRVRASRQIATGVTTTSDWSAPFNFTTINFPQPVVTFTAPPTLVCPSTLLTFNTSVSSGTAPFTYQWASRAAGTTDAFVVISGSTGASLSVAGGITSNTEFRVVVTDVNAQTSTSFATVNVTPIPQLASITGNATVCQNSASVYTIPSTPNTIAWSVTPATGVVLSGGTTANANITFANPGTYTVSVVVSNSCGTTSAQRVVQVNQQPAPIITSPSGSTTVCENTSSHTYAVSNPVPGATYNWSLLFGSGNIVSGQGTSQITVAWTAAGFGGLDAVQVTETVTACAASSASLNVIINRAPTATLTTTLPGGAVPTEVCGGSSLNVFNTDLPSGTPFTYSWSVTGPVSIVGSATSASVNLAFTNVTSTQLATVTLQQSIAGCQTRSSTANITVRPVPAPALSGPTEACSNTGGYTYTVTNNATHTNSWSVVGGSITSNNGNSIVVSWNSIGTGVVRVTQASTLCGSSTVSLNVNVSGSLTPSITVNTTATVCSGMQRIYTATGVPVGTAYAWTVNNGTIVGSSTGASVTVQWNTAGSGSVAVLATSSQGCTGATTTPVTIGQTPNLALTVNGSDVCFGQNGTVTIAGSQTGITYTVRSGATTVVSGNGNGANLALTVPSSFLASTATFTIFADNLAGCSGTLTNSAQVIVRPLPETRTLTGSTVCSNQNGTVTINNAQTGVTYTLRIGATTVATGNGAGTNLALTIPQANLVVGNNTITAEATLNACNLSLGSVTVVVNQAPNYALTVNGSSVCAGENGTLTIVNAETGVTYSVRRGVTTLTTGTVAATGNLVLTVLAGQLTGTETFTIFAERTNGCSGNLNNSGTITVRPLPQARTVAGSTVCSNVNGTVTVENAQSGVTYTLLTTTGTAVGTSQVGAGANLTFSIPQTSLAIGTNTFVVRGELSGCQVIITPSVVVTVNTFPLLDRTVAGSTVCAGVNGTVTIQNAEAGVQYTLVQGVTNVVSATAVANGPLVLTVPSAQLTVGANTYVIRADRLNGCSANLAQGGTITVNAVPVATTISGRTIVCANRPETYSINPVVGNSYSWSAVNGVINGSSAGNTVSVTWNNGVTTGQLTLTETNPSSCSRQNTITVNISTSLTPPVISGATVVCPNTTVQYTAPLTAGDSYTWTVVGGTFTVGATPNIINVAWGAPGDGSVRVIQSTPAGCSGESTISVVKRVAPEPVITGETAVCQNASVIYSAPTLVGSTYLWTITGGTITTGQGTAQVTVSWNGTGTGTLSVTQTSSQGCSGTRSINVTIDTAPTPAITGDNIACVNDVDTYQVTARAGDTYQWTVVGGSIISGQGTAQISVTWQVIGNGSVTVVQDSPGACAPVSAQRAVTVNRLPVASFSANPNACTGAQVTYLATNTAPTSTYAWSVSANGTIIGSTTGTQVTVVWNQAGAGTVTLVEQTPSCGVRQTVATVTVQTTPAPVISGIATLCRGEATTYSVAALTGTTYAWTVNGGTILSGQGTNSVSVRWDVTGVGSLSVAQTSALCGTFNASVNVTVNARPQPAVSGTFTVCQNTEYTYSTPAVPGNIYSWAVSGGQIIGANNTNTVRVRWTNVGNATLTIQESTPSCGAQTEFRTVVVRPQPSELVIEGSSQVCALTRDEQYSVSNVPGLTYQWTVSGGAVIAGQGTPNVIVAWGNRGQGRVTVSYGEGCERTASRDVTISAAAVAVQVTGDESICVGEQRTYNATVVPNASYNWSISGGTIVSGQGTPSVRVEWTNVGIAGLLVDLAGASSPGEVCPVRAGIGVTVNALPTPVLTGEEEVCANSQGVVYQVSTPAQGSIYSWNVQGGIIASRNDSLGRVVINWGSAGNGSISLTEESAAGCTGSVTLPVEIIAVPQVTASASTTIINLGGITDLRAQVTGVGANADLTYSWSPASTLRNPLTATPSATPSTTTTYVVVVTNEGLCSATAAITINVNTSVSVDEPTETGFFLAQNFPNPVSGATEIRFGVVKSGVVLLELRDVSGRSVATLLNGNFVTGQYSVSFNAGSLSTGTYFYTLITPDGQLTRQMIIVK